jgi:hypothetical protein
MPFVGLVSDPKWEPPEGSGEPERERRPRTWRIPWSLLIWVTLLIGLMLLVPVAGHAFGAFAGYLLLCFNVGLGFWRFDRWCAKQYWRGLRDYQA